MTAKDFVYKLPDDYEIKPEHRAKLDKVMDELKASNELAQQLLDIHVEIMESFAAELSAFYDTSSNKE